MEDTFTLTAAVSTDVPVFYDPPADVAPDEFVLPDAPEVVPLAVDAMPLVEMPADDLAALTEAQSQDRGQLGVEGFGGYLIIPQSEWTEADWSQQLYGDTAHHWADFGFA